MIYYEPSCKFKANHPEASARIQAYLRKKGIIVTGCCRPSQKLYTDTDTVLFNCTSCSIIVKEVHPETESMSVYEYLLKDNDFPWPDYHGERITVQDCFRARNDRATQEAVRQCMIRMKIVPVELADENYEKAAFDGPFLFHPIAENNMTIAPAAFSRIAEHVMMFSEEEQSELLKKQVAKYTTDRTAVYCNSCEKGISLGGGNPVHLLELITQDL